MGLQHGKVSQPAELKPRKLGGQKVVYETKPCRLKFIRDALEFVIPTSGISADEETWVMRRWLQQAGGMVQGGWTLIVIRALRTGKWDEEYNNEQMLFDEPDPSFKQCVFWKAAPGNKECKPSKTPMDVLQTLEGKVHEKNEDKKKKRKKKKVFCVDLTA